MLFHECPWTNFHPPCGGEAPWFTPSFGRGPSSRRLTLHQLLGNATRERQAGRYGPVSRPLPEQAGRQRGCVGPSSVPYDIKSNELWRRRLAYCAIGASPVPPIPPHLGGERKRILRVVGAAGA